MTRGEAVKYLVEHPDAVLRDVDGFEIRWKDGPVYYGGREEESSMTNPPYTVVRMTRRWKRHGGAGVWIECTREESEAAHGGIAFGASERSLGAGHQPLAYFLGYGPLPSEADHVWVKWEVIK